MQRLHRWRSRWSTRGSPTGPALAWVLVQPLVRARTGRRHTARRRRRCQSASSTRASSRRLARRARTCHGRHSRVRLNRTTRCLRRRVAQPITRDLLPAAPSPASPETALKLTLNARAVTSRWRSLSLRLAAKPCYLSFQWFSAYRWSQRIRRTVCDGGGVPSALWFGWAGLATLDSKSADAVVRKVRAGSTTICFSVGTRLSLCRFP